MTVTPVQILILSCYTSFEEWKLLGKCLFSISKTHIRTTCDQLRSLKSKFDKPIANYLLHAKTLNDSFADVGSPILDSNLIEFITYGVGHNYKEFRTPVHALQITKFDEFYDLAIQEGHLKKKMSSLCPQLQLL